MRFRTIHFGLVLAAAFTLGMPGAAVGQMYDKNQKLIMPERPTTDYSFLQGCWKTDPFKHSAGHPFGTSTYCFDANGRGTLQFENPIYTCRVTASASYQGSQLRFDDSDGTCDNGGRWWADHLDCRRMPDGAASCTGVSTDRAKKVVFRWTVALRREGPPPSEPRAMETPPPPAAGEPPAAVAPSKPKSLESLFERR